MRISLMKNGKIYNTSLPLSVNGSFWIYDKDKNDQKRNLVNVYANNGRWVLKSNFEIKICVNGVFVEEVFLEEWKLYELRVINDNYSYIIYTSPVYDKNIKRLELSVPEIKIGSGEGNTIIYRADYIKGEQCLITNNGNGYSVKNLTGDPVLYVNHRLVKECNLKIGDIIFIFGLRIIMCGNFILLSYPPDYVRYNSVILKEKIFERNVNENILENTELMQYDKSEYFFRMPRFRTTLVDSEVNIDPPPESEKQDEMPLAYTVGPMVTMGMTSLVSGITAVSSVAEGTQTLKSALPSLITCFAMLFCMLVWPMLQKRYTRIQQKKREEYRIKKYREYISERKEYIRIQVEKLRTQMIENNLPLADCEQIILLKKRNLWERKIEHNDFLNLRVGIGNVEPKIKVMYPEEHFTLSENNLRGELETLGNDTKIMQNVPVTINLTEKMVTAIIGKEELVKQFVYGLILQTMTFHSYSDLKIVIMTNEDNASKWKFLKQTMYLQNEDKSVRFFATSVDEASQVSVYLENHFHSRKYEGDDTSKIRTVDYKKYSPYFLVITDDYRSFRNIDIIKEISEEKINYGFSLLILQDRLLGLPSECSAFINLDVQVSGIIENELTKEKQQIFNADFIGDINIERAVKILANIPIDTDRERVVLPNKLGFLEMYGVGKIEQLNILNRWKNNNAVASLSSPVGVDDNGELFKLDIHEKFHGPHGLVAGMTGSGKSEFLITYILSMAINYSPEEVSFVLIDYKGGGLAGAFYNKETGVKIPHLAGTITNLDVNDMKRAIDSIDSELKRRQHIFAEARLALNESTIDIYKYQKLRREGKVKQAVPHLIIISDEFAELKAQHPEFMEQLISTARIGRSLGVHLILATQKPSGVVDDQIWSNTKFRVCLKVQDKSDSVDMLKRPEAASLHNVGRFYLQVGYNEFFALGQSAYAGVPYYNTDKLKKKVDTKIEFINNVGYTLMEVDEEEKNKAKSYGEELSNIVNYLYNLGKENKLESQKLWLDKIDGVIYVSELAKKYQYQANKFIIDPIIGEYDVPQKQIQKVLTLPLSNEGNVIIYGASGSGKDDLLSTIVFSTIIYHTPQEVSFYIVDFGAETLKMFEKAPFVGAVLLATDEDRINNLFKMLKEEVSNRKKLFQNNDGSYYEYCMKSGDSVPTIIVIINLYEAFKEMYPELEESFLQLTREGFKYGIIFIITTSGVNFINYKLKQNFKQNLVLQLNDTNDYSDIVGNTHGLYPSKIKGRGLVKIDGISEFQSASFKYGDNKAEYVKELCKKYSDYYKIKARAVPVLPNIINVEAVKDKIMGLDSIPVGIEKNSLKIATVNLRTKPITIISSAEGGILENFTPEFIRVCRYNENLLINIIDADKTLEDDKFEKCGYFKSNLDMIFDKMYLELDKIYSKYVKNNYDEECLKDRKDILIIINGIGQFKSKVTSDTYKKFDKFTKIIKEVRKVSLVIIDTIDNIKQLEYEEWYKLNVTNNYGVWLGDNITEQYTIKLTKNPSYLREEIGNRFGYNIKKGVPVLIKTLSDIEDEGDIDNE